MTPIRDSVNRVPCIVPGCRRTIGRERYVRQFHCQPGSWICCQHWRMVPTSWKRVIARHKRQERRFGFFPRENAYHRVWDRVYRLLWFTR